MSYTAGQAQYWDGSSWQPAIGRIEQNWAGSVVHNALGTTTILTPGTAHTKSAWSQIIGSATAGGCVLAVNAACDRLNTNTATLLDIAKGASGSETIIAENINIGAWFRTSTFEARNTVFLPTSISQGDRISARIQSADTAGTTLLYNPVIINSPNFRAGTSALVTMGADTATSGGVAMSASSNTYVQVIGSATSNFIGLCSYISEATGNVINAGYTVLTYATGAAGSEVDIFTHTIFDSASESMYCNAVGIGYMNSTSGVYAARFSNNTMSGFYRSNIYPIYIPQGTRIAVKSGSANKTFIQASVLGIRP